MTNNSRLHRFLVLFALALTGWLLAAPARADVHVIPRDCAQTGCAVPTIDGSFFVQEYADASRSRMQDFQTGKSNGEIRLMLDGNRLFVAIRADGSTKVCNDTNEADDEQVHRLELMFSPNTGLGRNCSAITNDDRLIVIEYDTLNAAPGPGTFPSGMGQFWGVPGGWAPVPAGGDWPVTKFTSLNVLRGDGTGNFEPVREFQIEMMIELPFMPGNGVDEMQFAARLTALCDTTRYQFPNQPEGFRNTAWCDWETVTFGKPDPIAFDFVSYNVGQMPFPIADGGTGEPMEFGFIAANAEHSCMQETWTFDERREIVEVANMILTSAGKNEITALNLPQDFDFLEDTVDALGNVLPEALITLVASNEAFIVVSVAGAATPILLGDALGIGKNGEDSGLLLTSSRPVGESAIGEYPHDLCAGEDCLEDKGFIWARLLTDAARPPIPGEDCDGTICIPPPPAPRAFSTDEFVDVFCTHLQNDEPIFASDSSARRARDAQADVLRQVVEQFASKDRPALMVGDFNFDGNNADVARQLYAIFDLNRIHSFETLNSTHSDRYDLGVFDPFLTTEIDAARQSRGAIGLASSLDGDNCFASDPLELKRLDYAMLVPADVVGIPTFALEEGSTATPVPFFPDNSLDPNNLNSSHRAPEDGNHLANPIDRYPVGGPAEWSGECLSDHAALFIRANLVRTIDPLRWNPAKAHEFTFSVKRVVSRSGDCFGCGDPDFYGELSGTRTLTTASGTVENSLGEDNFGPVDDLSDPRPGLSRTWTSPGLIDQAFADAELRFRLFDEDVTSGDDRFATDDWDEGQTESDIEGSLYRILGITGRATSIADKGERLDCDLSGNFGPTQSCTWRTHGVLQPSSAEATFELKTRELEEP